MNTYDEKFLSIFNEHYPFERYIIKNPKPIGEYGDCVLTEIFVPNTIIEPILDDNGKLITFTRINQNNVYIKIRGNLGEVRFNYLDFADHIREEIHNIMIEDMGETNYESLYVDHEDENDELEKELEIQKQLIISKYGNDEAQYKKK